MFLPMTWRAMAVALALVAAAEAKAHRGSDARMLEADLEGEWPPNCNWECYYDKYPHLAERGVERTEEEALKNYLHAGVKLGRDCTCDDNSGAGGGAGAGASAAGSEQDADLQGEWPPNCNWECYYDRYPHLPEHGVQRTEEEALKNYLHVGVKWNRDCTCEGKGGAGAGASAAGNAQGEQHEARPVAAKEEAAVTSWPPNCNWECYYDRYPHLAERGIDRTEEEALKNYLHVGVKWDRDCTCEGKGAAGSEHVGQHQAKPVATEEEAAVTSWPPNCDWECYYDKYPHLAERGVERTEEEALKNYLHVGVKWDRDCTCEIKKSGAGAEASAAGSAQGGQHQANAVAEASAAAGSWPPNCDWECYYDRYPHLPEHGVQRNEEEALKNYLHVGVKWNRDCTCEGNGGAGAGAGAAVGSEHGGQHQAKPMAEEDEAAAGSWPPNCNWECYYDRYPHLTEHGVQRNEEEALKNYLHVGVKWNRDCTCEGNSGAGGGASAAGSGHEGQHQAKPVAEATEATGSWPPNCNWECYYDKYPHIAERGIERTEEEALKNYLHAGVKGGRDCTCEAKDNNGAGVGASAADSEQSGVIASSQEPLDGAPLLLIIGSLSFAAIFLAVVMVAKRRLKNRAPKLAPPLEEEPAYCDEPADGEFA